MLKLLLGHWKAHKKKPSLLPEDGDVHFEDPSTINPIFEDSDSSISSSKRSVKTKSNKNQLKHEQNQNEIDAPVINELIDVSVPTHLKDSLIPNKVLPKDDIIDTEEAESSIVIKTLSESNDIKKSGPTIRLESKVETPNLDLSESKVETPNLDLSESKVETPNLDLSESKVETPNLNLLEPNVETPNLSSLETKVDNVKVVPVESFLHDDKITKALSKDNTQNSETKSDKKMRLYNPPSTSAIRESKKLIESTAVENLTQAPTSKLSDVQTVNKEVNKQKTPKENTQNKLDNNETLFQKNKESSLPPIRSDQPEKPAKLKAKAIDELIKKFQGSVPESDNSASLTKKPEKKHLTNLLTKSEKITPNASNKDNSSSSPSVVFEKEINKITKLGKEKLSETTESVTETAISNTKIQEVEALSNIFKFPPPPPLEPLQNKSSLHGRILKERKFNNSLATSSKVKENEDNLKASEHGKTRSDSSLDRTRTASSSKPKENKENLEAENRKETSAEVPQQTSSNKESPIKNLALEQNHTELKKSHEVVTEIERPKENKSFLSRYESNREKLGAKSKPDNKTHKSEPNISNNSTSVKTESSPTESKVNSDILLNNPSNSIETNTLKSASQKQKSSVSKAFSKQISSISKATAKQNASNETDNIKSHSEDSGITRGDQISSETTQETPLDNPPEEQASPDQPPPRKNKKEKKLKSTHKKGCKHCRHGHKDNGSIKRIHYDEYYDGLTGIRHFHKGKHSDSWTSDISWEEKELLRRLRSKRGTVRSNTPSTKSRHSKHHFKNENHFRRHHNFRHSISDDSTFYGSSMCSCDICWAQYIRDYAYGRASLRGMSPIQEGCTCRSSRHNYLGRRVQFQSDTIHEASPSATRTATPAPPADSKEGDEADDRSSQKSSKTKDGDSVQTGPVGTKKKKSKMSDETYRFVTPWELEEWDMLMKKRLLRKRRNRARCMGLMALAMVVFIGLVVTILMVYLRRKVI